MSTTGWWDISSDLHAVADVAGRLRGENQRLRQLLGDAAPAPGIEQDEATAGRVVGLREYQSADPIPQPETDTP
jgi:hypothetical protein